jgi:cytochrome c
MMVIRLVSSILCLLLSCFSELSAAPLHDAAKEGDLKRIEQLLAEGADINELTGPNTPLHYAVQKKHPEAAELLIRRGADVNAARTTWGTPLHDAAAVGLTDIVRLMLERGANPNALRQSETPLHLAARNGHTDIVKLLLDHGADINALTVLDEPALHLAIIQGHVETAELLRKRGTMAPAVEDIAGLLASADLKRGEKLAQQCSNCHVMDQSDEIKTGPPLWNIVGRPKASLEKFEYSPALKAVGGEWTYQALNAFIAHPAATISGTSMVMQGQADPRDRADLIIYLRSLSNNPIALP